MKCILQLIIFARVYSHVDDLNGRNKCLTDKLLKQGYRYHKLRKTVSKFNHRHKIQCQIKIYVACFWCQSFSDVSPNVCSYYFSAVAVAE